jgi:protein-S-isoprenylcysteine O-methyltransferase Ste14
LSKKIEFTLSRAVQDMAIACQSGDCLAATNAPHNDKFRTLEVNMNENIFRILAALILLTGMGTSGYFRRKADRETGEKIPRKVDGTPMMLLIRIGGLILWLSPLAYLTNPQWMTWSKLGLPDWARWAGVGIGILCVLGIYWLFSSIGNGISPTSATRKQHQLSTSGPYRWVRHPLYTIGSSFFISFGLMTDNWFIAMLGVLAFILMAVRTPKEESSLIEKFGDEYREYMKQTGRFFPKLGGNS